MENQELSNRIKVQRAIKNITQEELATQIGVTRKTINTIETGKFVPSTILAIKLARYFEIRVEELFILADK
jgi:putative transcriptional regulator